MGKFFSDNKIQIEKIMGGLLEFNLYLKKIVLWMSCLLWYSIKKIYQIITEIQSEL